MQSNYGILIYLLENYSLDINETDSEGRTALDYYKKFNKNTK